MNMREVAAEYRLSHWTQILRDRAQSGLSIKAYCKKAGIRENVYYYWQKRLREAACEQLITPGFAEVRLATTEGQPTTAGIKKPGEIRVEVGGGQITTDSTYPEEKMVRLLRALAQP